MECAVKTCGLSKRYRDAVALREVDLAVPEGSVFGLVGPNGAGKTTMLRILAGLSRQSRGSVSFFGVEKHTNEIRSQISYLPDVPGFYPWMTARQTIDLAAQLFSVAPAERAKRIDALLEMVGLANDTKPVGGYSRGMKQRLGMAQALVGAPRLLMLDEPTSALDPIGRRELLNLISSLEKKTTVIFSTHILADVERVCDHIALIDKGSLVKQGSMEEFMTRTKTHTLLLTVASEPTQISDYLSARPWCKSITFQGQGQIRLVVNDLNAARYEIPAALTKLGMALVAFEGGEVSLEEVFVSLVEGDH